MRWLVQVVRKNSKEVYKTAKKKTVKAAFFLGFELLFISVCNTFNMNTFYALKKEEAKYGNIWY